MKTELAGLALFMSMVGQKNRGQTGILIFCDAMVFAHGAFIAAGETPCPDNLAMRFPISRSISSNAGIIGTGLL